MILSPQTGCGPSVLSIQSHVAYGYVGNRAAVFPLQRRGHDVIALNTVQFSNHTGYGAWEGDMCTPDHLHRILMGVEARGGFALLRAVLTGYIGDPGTGAVIHDWVCALKQKNPDLIYVCDPVMGDTGRGFFVKDGIPDFFRGQLVPCADILTPNVFELEALTGQVCATHASIQAACVTLHERGVMCVLVTSVPAAHDGMIGMMVCRAGCPPAYRETARLPIDPAPNGAGDLTAALFLSYWLESGDVATALERTARAVFRVFEETFARGGRELALIAAQDVFVD